MEELNNFKIKALSSATGIQSFTNNWEYWRTEAITVLEEKGNNIFELGNNLSQIFKSTSSATSDNSRSQSAVAQAGAGFEALLVWYLSLVFWNTNVVPVRWKKALLPEIIQNALTVRTGNHTGTSEADIVAYTVPTHNSFDVSEIKGINLSIESELKKEENDLSLNVLQAKTTWGEQAQVPMLWDMVYNSQSTNNNVQVGIKGVSPQSFNKFSYSFATLPSRDDLSKFKATSVNTKRVTNLTGGNFWGYPSKEGVCQNINEYFMRNFPNVFIGNSIQSHANSNIQKDPNYVKKFLDLDFTE
jgi:hypothetical protein